MANWTSLDLNSLLPGQPLTSSIALAYEENPRAIAEGSSGSPKVQGDALDNLVLGRISRSNSDSPIGFNDLDDCRGVLLLGPTAWLSFQEVQQIKYSTDNGATYGAYVNLSTESDGSFNALHIDLKATGVPAGVNAFQIRNRQPDSGISFDFLVVKIGSQV